MRAPRFYQSSRRGGGRVAQILLNTNYVGGYLDSADPRRGAPRFSHSADEGTQILPILREGGIQISSAKIKKPTPPVTFSEWFLKMVGG